MWAAILLRDHRNPAVQRAMDLWMAHVLRYSRRDQLSINTALRQTGLKADRWELDNHASWFHTWPHPTGRTPAAGMRLPLNATMPVPTQLQQSRSDLLLARRDLDTARAAVQAVQQALERARQDITDLTGRLGATERACAAMTQRHAQAAEAMVALRASTSWRLTAPLRQLKTWLN